jgi:6,7-dimethyl-8-ribityllumazine synthase
MATAGKNLSQFDAAQLPNGARFRVGIVVSEWNSEITHALRDGAIEVLRAAGVPEDGVVVHDVPGAFELPLGAQWLLHAPQPCDAVIAVGAVIRGETAHFDFVCQAASQGVLRVGLDSGKPAIFCVLTDDTIEQSRARSGGVHGNKGVEAAVACLKMLALKHAIGD